MCVDIHKCVAYVHVCVNRCVFIIIIITITIILLIIIDNDYSNNNNNNNNNNKNNNDYCKMMRCCFCATGMRVIGY